MCHNFAPERGSLFSAERDPKIEEKNVNCGAHLPRVNQFNPGEMERTAVGAVSYLPGLTLDTSYTAFRTIEDPTFNSHVRQPPKHCPDPAHRTAEKITFPVQHKPKFTAKRRSTSIQKQTLSRHLTHKPRQRCYKSSINFVHLDVGCR